MSDAPLKALSRSLSWLLRHAAHDEGLLLDPEGFAAIGDVLERLAARHPGISRAHLERVVAEVEPIKQRFRIEGECIRANYGHSLAERLVHARAEPPSILLHGTAQAVVDEILRSGLRPMGRQYVHLTPDRTLALAVGRRHGAAVLLEIDSAAAHADGTGFYRANESFWLADEVPARFLSLAASKPG